VTLRLVAADYGDSPANSSKKYWDKLVHDFEAEHPGIKVEVGVYSWNEVDRKVKEMVAAGHAPDMAQIGAYADYGAAGKLYRADEVLSIPVQADFASELSDAGKVNRVQYGMPFAASTWLLFYNKTLFSEVGITPPTSWSELAADARALKAKGVRCRWARRRRRRRRCSGCSAAATATWTASVPTTSTPPRTWPPSTGSRTSWWTRA
jgi:multiple sugar transport system substrate-binding protein